MKKLLFVFGMLISTLSFSQTPADIPQADKLYGLSELWSNAKYNFVNFDLSKINWDSTYQAFIPKVMETKSLYDYYRTLMQMCALLKDGHSNVYFPDTIYSTLGRIPIVTRLIENKVIITGILNDTLEKEKIDTGDEVIEINGMNAVEYGQKYVMPYQSSSTKQDLMVRTYTYSLFSGPKNEPVELKLKKKDGSIVQASVSRKMKRHYHGSPYTFRVTPTNIGILEVDGFDLDNYDHLFDSIYPALLKTKGLIIDVRQNGGGNTEQGSYIIAHLIDKPVQGESSKTREYIPSFTAWHNPPFWLVMDPYTVDPLNGVPIYKNPVVVLTSAMTFSSAEDFLVEYVDSKRGIIIGQPSGGSTGQPFFFKLPGGGSARVCTRHCMFPGGKEFVGIGVIPDIDVEETVQSIQTHTDIVLNRAIQYLEEKTK